MCVFQELSGLIYECFTVSLGFEVWGDEIPDMKTPCSDSKLSWFLSAWCDAYSNWMNHLFKVK